MRVEVVFLPAAGGVWRCELELPQGATLAQALAASGISDACPEIDWRSHQAGVFGKVLPPETVLQDGDRVEVYRPLRLDPKQARALRAARGRGVRR